MREIKFRGKRVDNGEWVYGHYVRYGYTDKQKDYIVPGYASDLYAFEVEPTTVGQYTGLKDENGSECKEGLFGKYIISKADGSEISTDARYFVLRYDKDSAAWMALRSYALHTTNRQLQKDLLEESRKYQGENKLQRFDFLEEFDRLNNENADLKRQVDEYRNINKNLNELYGETFSKCVDLQDQLTAMRGALTQIKEIFNEKWDRVNPVGTDWQETVELMSDIAKSQLEGK